MLEYKETTSLFERKKRKQLHCSSSDYKAQWKKLEFVLDENWETGTFGQYRRPVKGSNAIILYKMLSQKKRLD